MGFSVVGFAVVGFLLGPGVGLLVGFFEFVGLVLVGDFVGDSVETSEHAPYGNLLFV